MLIIVSGVSGCGKNTIINKLMENNKRLKFFKSATTRPKREGETQHYFLTQKQFENKLSKGEFFESENVHGFMYGMLMKDIEKIISDDKHDYIRDVDVHGNQRLRKFFAGKTKVVSIFLDAPNKVLRERLLGRGESEERVKVRLARAKLERDCKKDYDLVINNIDLEKTISKLEKLISA